MYSLFRWERGAFFFCFPFFLTSTINGSSAIDLDRIGKSKEESPPTPPLTIKSIDQLKLALHYAQSLRSDASSDVSFTEGSLPADWSNYFHPIRDGKEFAFHYGEQAKLFNLDLSLQHIFFDLKEYVQYIDEVPPSLTLFYSFYFTDCRGLGILLAGGFSHFEKGVYRGCDFSIDRIGLDKPPLSVQIYDSLFVRCNLKGLDLSGACVEHSIFSDVNCCHIDFTGAKMAGVQFIERTDCRGVNFSSIDCGDGPDSLPYFAPSVSLEKAQFSMELAFALLKHKKITKTQYDSLSIDRKGWEDKPPKDSRIGSIWVVLSAISFGSIVWVWAEIKRDDPIEDDWVEDRISPTERGSK